MPLNADELSLIRNLVAEPNEDQGWTDDRFEELSAATVRDDGTNDMRALAAVVWEAKAAEAVDMVDVSESGSSRSMGQVHQHALKMAERYRAPAVSSSASAGRTRTRRIVRE